jgi:RHS repeat-associated protein
MKLLNYWSKVTKSFLILFAFSISVLLLPKLAFAELYFVHNDQLGANKLTDTQRNIVWQGKRQPFGTTEVVAGEEEFNQRFPGQYFDEESGLHYNYFRDYDPSTGRYIQSAPIGLRGGPNQYSYANANPIKYIDEFGLTAGVPIFIPKPLMSPVRIPLVRPNVRDTQIVVDPNKPELPEDDKCDKDYFADKLACESSCGDSSIKAAACKSKAWGKWVICKNNTRPGNPRDPEDPGPFIDPGYWMSAVEEEGYILDRLLSLPKNGSCESADDTELEFG